MSYLYDYTECDEIADNMADKNPAFTPQTFAEAVAYVRERMPDESMQVIDNTAEALCRRHRTAWFALKTEG